MEITYNILSISTDETKASGFVYDAHVEVIASNVDGVEVKTTISAQFNYEEGMSLIPYADLTKEQVLTWVKNSIGSNRINKIEAYLESQMTARLNATEKRDLPWN